MIRAKALQWGTFVGIISSERTERNSVKAMNVLSSSYTFFLQEPSLQQKEKTNDDFDLELCMLRARAVELA